MKYDETSAHLAAGTFPSSLAHLEYRVFAIQTEESRTECVIPPLTYIPAGPFLMGSDPAIDPDACSSEFPQHSLTLPSYFIATFPVTVLEYSYFLNASGYPAPRALSHGMDWKSQRQRWDYPVVGLMYEDAQAYAHWLAELTGQSWRLPTEGEWEKAGEYIRGGIPGNQPLSIMGERSDGRKVILL
jgi:formylglycine-generating enzyme required for sulfatase activity